MIQVDELFERVYKEHQGITAVTDLRAWALKVITREGLDINHVAVTASKATGFIASRGRSQVYKEIGPSGELRAPRKHRNDQTGFLTWT